MVHTALALMVLVGFVACFTLMTVEVARVMAQLWEGRRRRAESAPVGEELQIRAAAVVTRLATRAGISTPACLVVTLLGAPPPGRPDQAQHAARHGTGYEVGTGGFAVTRLRKDPPTIVLAAAALTDLNDAALESLVAHELGHTQLHATRAARYGWLAAYLAAVVPAVALTILAFSGRPRWPRQH